MDEKFEYNLKLEAKPWNIEQVLGREKVDI